MDLIGKEMDVIKLVAEGRSNVFIARKLCRSESTVRSRLKKIYIKLDIKGDQFNKRLKLALLGQKKKEA